MSEVVRRSYGTDVSDEEWDFVLPYLLLSREDNRSREHNVRELFNAVRSVVKTGNHWRFPDLFELHAAGCHNPADAKSGRSPS